MRRTMPPGSYAILKVMFSQLRPHELRHLDQNQVSGPQLCNLTLDVKLRWPSHSKSTAASGIQT